MCTKSLHIGCKDCIRWLNLISVLPIIWELWFSDLFRGVNNVPLSHQADFFSFFLFFFSFIFISWRLITLQYCSGFCHTLTWISHRFTCIPHPNPPSHLPLHPIPLGLPSALALSTCLMHPTWAGDLFHPCFNAILSEHPTLTFSHRIQKSVLYICVSITLYAKQADFFSKGTYSLSLLFGKLSYRLGRCLIDVADGPLKIDTILDL